MNQPLKAILATLVGATVLAPVGTISAQEDKPYRFVGDKVDFGTYNGYRRYHSACHVCHGPDGLGSSFAPPLVESLKTLSQADFYNTVTAGKEGNFAGENSVMPSFAENPNVMKNLGDIYAYLKARSDDALPRGRPKHLAKGQ
jgi:methanol metabolism-related c-type cytochrome